METMTYNCGSVEKKSTWTYAFFPTFNHLNRQMRHTAYKVAVALGEKFPYTDPTVLDGPGYDLQVVFEIETDDQLPAILAMIKKIKA